MNPYVVAVPHWLWSLGVLLGLVVAGLIAHWLLFGLAGRIAARAQRPAVNFMVARSGAPTQLLIPLLLISLALPELALPSRLMELLQRLVGMGFIAGAAWLLIALLEVMEDVIDERYPTDIADNLNARRIRTQARLLKRIAITIVILVAAALILMKFPSIEHLGTSLLASAGLAGLAAGIAARPMLANLIAGLQLALTEPIRIDDAVLVEGEFGYVEEINTTYVVVRIWDQRRLVMPLAYFIEHPFQNWTLNSADLLGTVTLHVDYRVPVEEVRQELQRIVQGTPLWDGRVWNLQVTDATDSRVELRAMVSAAGAGALWDLRVHVREKLIAFLQERHPQSLPRVRAEVTSGPHVEQATPATATA